MRLEQIFVRTYSIMENGLVPPAKDKWDRSNHTSDELSGYEMDGSTDSASSAGHKRSLSGSILSKLSFLRPTIESRTTSSDTIKPNGVVVGPETSQTSASAMVLALQQKKTRKRKGSLRKTALLGGSTHLKLEGRERPDSHLEQLVIPLIDPASDASIPRTSPKSLDESPTPRQSYEREPVPGTPRSIGKPRNLTIHDDTGSEESLPVPGMIRKPISGDMSTTDEEEMLTLPRSTATVSNNSLLKKPTSLGADSYFPYDLKGLQRRRSANKPRSPLAVSVEPVIVPETWDYTETEWWGWVVLVVTWVVFVVGMGSCLGVWSWAWDVGETPYAPPELEDDPTLPIVGYYPALIILTTVMAWVWVTIAWVGMKYFKHAKISGEDV